MVVVLIENSGRIDHENDNEIEDESACDLIPQVCFEYPQPGVRHPAAIGLVPGRCLGLDYWKNDEQDEYNFQRIAALREIIAAPCPRRRSLESPACLMLVGG